MARYVPVVLLECHHYTSCLEVYMKFCYHYMCRTDYYCFISELLSVSVVTQELTAVSEKWQYIGQELGVEQSLLRYIHTNCLWRVLSKRFQRCTTTWKDIVGVLRTPHIGESHLADHLEEKYCSSELANLAQ